MLNRSKPALRRAELERAVIQQVVALELLGLVAVVNDRANERIRVDVEHRALDLRRPPLDADVLGAPPGNIPAVADLLLEVDAVAAAPEAIALLNGHAAGVGPAQRYHEFVGAAEFEGRLRGRKLGQVRRLRPTRCGTHPGLDEAEGLTARIEEPDELRVILGDRVFLEGGPLQRAADAADRNIEDVGADRDQRRPGDSSSRLAAFRDGRRTVLRGDGRQILVGRRQIRRGEGLFALHRCRRGGCLRPVVPLPRLPGHPAHEQEESPDEETLVIHSLAVLGLVTRCSAASAVRGWRRFPGCSPGLLPAG